MLTKVLFLKKMDSYKEILKKESESNSKIFSAASNRYLFKIGRHKCFIILEAGNPNELKYYEAISIIILAISVVNFVLLSQGNTVLNG